MRISKDQVTASISHARAHLDQALAALEHLPAFDPCAIGFAAHALHNYLTVTGGTIDLLLLALDNYPDPEVRTGLEALRRVTDIMTHTVNQLMNTSSRASPKLIRENVDLAILAQRVCDYYQRIADHKQIHITCASTAKTHEVRSDRVVLAAVMDNLLSNAVKYSQPGKQIWVQIRCESDHLICSVRDQGPGLSAADQAKLFQRGVRLSAIPTGGEPSTGFGLAVARELMELLGGDIWCESAPGQGACFSIRLPSYGESIPSGPSGMQGPHGGSPAPPNPAVERQGKAEFHSPNQT
jgi:signal transduction histidine kinase